MKLILWMLFFGLAVNAELSPELQLSKKQCRQGDYIYVLAKNVKQAPELSFKGETFRMFKIDSESYRALLPIENLTKPGNCDLIATIPNQWEEKIQIKIEDNKKPISKIWLDPHKNSLEATDKELDLVYKNLHKLSEDKLWQGKFSYPSGAKKSSPFGVKRSYNGGPVDSYHKGLDFAAKMGSPVLAPADAKVLLAAYEKDGFVVHGNTVILDHGQGLTSIYMHLSKIDVKNGQLIKQGEKIGEVGHTGISTGPHLHWGTYLYGISVDPENFVKDLIN